MLATSDSSSPAGVPVFQMQCAGGYLLGYLFECASGNVAISFLAAWTAFLILVVMCVAHWSGELRAKRSHLRHAQRVTPLDSLFLKLKVSPPQRLRVKHGQPLFISQKNSDLPSFGYVAGPTSGRGEHEKTARVDRRKAIGRNCRAVKD